MSEKRIMMRCPVLLAVAGTVLIVLLVNELMYVSRSSTVADSWIVIQDDEHDTWAQHRSSREEMFSKSAGHERRNEAQGVAVHSTDDEGGILIDPTDGVGKNGVDKRISASKTIVSPPKGTASQPKDIPISPPQHLPLNDFPASPPKDIPASTLKDVPAACQVNHADLQAKLRQQLLREKQQYMQRMPTLGDGPTNNIKNQRSLPKEAIDSVEKFVFFIGYPRSGHSIIGSMMDAHPNMIISHELMLFKKLTEDRKFAFRVQDKAALFNTIYQKSLEDARSGWHSPNIKRVKGYSLEVGTPWHGKYNGTLKVIGDKSGGMTVTTFNVNKKRFEAKLVELHKITNVPFYVIHVVRNPYDIIATSTLYGTHVNSSKQNLHKMLVKGKVNATTLQVEYKETIAIKLHSQKILKLARGVDEMIRTLNLTVLEIHSEDFVRDPKKTILRICAFLDVPCPESYLQACYDKAYKTSSKSRNLVAWPEDLIADVQTEIGTIPFLRRYTFEND